MGQRQTTNTRRRFVHSWLFEWFIYAVSYLSTRVVLSQVYINPSCCCWTESVSKRAQGGLPLAEDQTSKLRLMNHPDTAGATVPTRTQVFITLRPEVNQWNLNLSRAGGPDLVYVGVDHKNLCSVMGGEWWLPRVVIVSNCTSLWVWFSDITQENLMFPLYSHRKTFALQAFNLKFWHFLIWSCKFVLNLQNKLSSSVINRFFLPWIYFIIFLFYFVS